MDGAEIFAVGEDGGDPVQLTQDGAINTGPAWSPDGNWIVFYSYRQSISSAIFKIPAGGSGKMGLQIQLTPASFKASNPCWLPVSASAGQNIQK